MKIVLKSILKIENKIVFSFSKMERVFSKQYFAQH